MWRAAAAVVTALVLVSAGAREAAAAWQAFGVSDSLPSANVVQIEQDQDGSMMFVSNQGEVVGGKIQRKGRHDNPRLKR